MGRGNTDLNSYEYDKHLASKGTRVAKQELKQRTIDRRRAHDSSGIGYHFGLGDAPVRVESKEHFKKVLDQRGLMLATDVKKNLR